MTDKNEERLSDAFKDEIALAFEQIEAEEAAYAELQQGATLEEHHAATLRNDDGKFVDLGLPGWRGAPAREPKV